MHRGTNSYRTSRTHRVRSGSRSKFRSNDPAISDTTRTHVSIPRPPNTALATHSTRRTDNEARILNEQACESEEDERHQPRGDIESEQRIRRRHEDGRNGHPTEHHAEEGATKTSGEKRVSENQSDDGGEASELQRRLYQLTRCIRPCTCCVVLLVRRNERVSTCLSASISLIRSGARM
jgi:hypothetical protein